MGFLLFTPPGHEGLTLPISITSTDELGNRLYQTQVKTVLNRVQHVGTVYHEVLLLEYRGRAVLKFSCSHTAGCRDAACTANGPSESYDHSLERCWVENVPRTTAELRETVRAFQTSWESAGLVEWFVEWSSTHQKRQEVESLA